ncbi:neuromedin-U receptor 2-like [Tubulanus polymorphus]|uniref:neuromedin-U receptor 2-like n=1 Tax=Tubulanus polymorphus TaxID=672921 RepID=UPI003DA3B148
MSDSEAYKFGGAFANVSRSNISELAILNGSNFLPTPQYENSSFLCENPPGFNNLSDEELLIAALGERRHTSFPLTIVLTLIYCLIFVSGTVGNTCTCIVIAKNTYMKTATNYYLFSLAISDMLTLVLGLPPEVFGIWQAYPWVFGKPFCYFKIFLSEMTSSASVLTITAFTIERYIAICHPIRSQTISNPSRAVRIIIICWLIACGAASPYTVYVELFHAVCSKRTKQPIPDSLTCNIRPTRFNDAAYLFQISTFTLFITPMSIITVLYILIGITLRKSAGLVRQTSEDYGATTSTTNRMQSRKTVLKMLVAVVVAFFVCWAPFHLQRLWAIYIPQDKWTDALSAVHSHIFNLSGVLYFVSSTINPILYNLMSKKYREAFKSTLCCCLPKKSLNRLGRSRYYSERSNTYVSSFHSTINTNRNRGATFRACDNGSGNKTATALGKSNKTPTPAMHETDRTNNVNACNNGNINLRNKNEEPVENSTTEAPNEQETVCATVYLPKHQIIGCNNVSKNPGTFV